ncbi:MAG TPA: CDP-diacylglycerol O-phosphatidyltransferase [Candidatus Binatia bacterium]|nr:CDP-diacylglycerol O-phosphatidyltransferase [Candidatus Binatia bacterium]
MPTEARDATVAPRATPAERVAAWAVHVYTACGALTALAALVAAAGGRFAAAFGWLWLAVAIDATDGTFARAARVKQVLPHFDGAKLDDIVDYLTFVLVPIFVMLQAGILEGALGVVAATAATLASAYRFCHSAAKTADHFFTGFPSYWNIVALYLYVFEPAPAVSAALVLVLAALVLVPLRFIYPSRMPTLRRSSVGLGVVWAVLVGILVLRLESRPKTLAAVSLYYPLYYTLASFALDWESRRAARRARGVN